MSQNASFALRLALRRAVGGRQTLWRRGEPTNARAGGCTATASEIGRLAEGEGAAARLLNGKVLNGSTGSRGNRSSLNPQELVPPRGAEPAQRIASTTVPSSWGPLRAVAYRAGVGDILAVVSGVGEGHHVPVRIHDACLTGEVLGSLKCDCGQQLQMTLSQQTRQKLGVIIYMPQEGRGIGLANKIAAYNLQEEQGLDTVDANLALGLPAEMRDYAAVPYILQDLGIQSLVLMTNNPYKVQQLRSLGAVVHGTAPVIHEPTSQVTSDYLEAKRLRMGHQLPEAPGRPWAKPSGLPEPAAQLLADLSTEIAVHRDSDRPFVLLSFATSMDGFIAGVRKTPGGDLERHAVALSGEASMQMTHHMRGCVDAILVGVGTVRVDDPRLDVREEGAGRSPRPVVLDSELRTPPACKLLAHEAEGGRPPTFVLCTDEGFGASGPSVARTPKAERAAALEAAGAVVLRCRADAAGRVCLEDAWRVLRKAGVGSVMVEGGAEVIVSLLRGASGADRVVVTQAGTILGSGVPWAVPGCRPLGQVSSFTLGPDAVFSAKPGEAPGIE